MNEYLIEKFYFFLRNIYGEDYIFSENFLVSEYNKVGFNKIGYLFNFNIISNILGNNITYEIS